ncbi:S-adenosylmethionine:tRNA ribosyltransferase-isomerase [Actinopolymorpha alba]|uniref:S-adenosylmethionine:tRNA ribosyltransferase-isomerase n=1 Tax=Actinopolymorpha alba TaxID=533267 RepID=UPI00037D789E|nr:S-adenosylmethionine:tRNA ribosyltransferase-isomerase [Actinopolymorpha alba]
MSALRTESVSQAIAPSLEFELPADLEAHEPPEARGLSRDGVRLLVGQAGLGMGPDGAGTTPDVIRHQRFADLPDLLEPGDVLVVNRSGTLPAAIDLPDGHRTVHFSTLAPDGSWLVELRRDAEPDASGQPGERIGLPGGAEVVLRERHVSGRLWHARVTVTDVPAYLAEFGRPIRYGYVAQRWPLDDYQTAFATVPGSAEMPSAGRPFTPELVTRLVARGVLVVPVTLHTGVASPEFHEPPYAEWFEVPEPTARVVNGALAAGGRVVAVGTTAVRALESAVAPDAAAANGGTPVVTATEGWTDLVITPHRGVSVVSGLLTGLHEPRASHLLMLEAIAGAELVHRCYAAALEEGYLWHEFGDLNLLLP